MPRDQGVNEGLAQEFHGHGEASFLRLLEEALGRKRLGSWGLGLLVLLLTVAGLPWLGEDLDRAALDMTVRAAAAWRTPHPDLVIVGIDTETLATVPERWPWPRDRYARLLEAVASTGPRLIIFDLLLQQLETRDAGVGDRALAATLQRLGNVHLISLIEQKLTDADVQKRHFRSASLFREAAAGEGFVWSWVDGDGLVRSFVLRDALLERSSCVLQVARLLRPDLPDPPAADEEGLSRSLVAFARRGGETPFWSALDFLEGRVPTGTLAGRVVVLGATAPILHDFHRTALGLITGPRLLAAMLDTLLQNRVAIRPVGRAWRLFLVIFGVLAGGWATRRGGRRPWVGLVGGILATLVLWAAICLGGGLALPFFPLWAGCVLAGLTVIALTRLLELLSWQALQAEAAAAGLVQRQLFPPATWNGQEFVSFGSCQPCSAAGGDYFDTVKLGDQDNLFLVCDVAGHGIGAAMVASMLKSAVASFEDQEGFSLETAINRLNGLLFRLFRQRKMVTGVFCRLEEKTRRVTLVSAGHVTSLIVRADGRVEEVGAPSFPLGMRAVTRLKMVPISLEPGDTLVLYSDGLIETVDWQNKMLGYPGFKTMLARRAPLVPGAGVVDQILEEIRRFAKGRPAADDMTILLLHRRQGPFSSVAPPDSPGVEIVLPSGSES